MIITVQHSDVEAAAAVGCNKQPARIGLAAELGENQVVEQFYLASFALIGTG